MVFFDAAGTLIRPREPVGETYARVARDYGVEISAQTLENRFVEAMARQPPMAFGQKLLPADLDRAERIWWSRLVKDVFDEPAFTSHSEVIFERLYEHFRKRQAWVVFADVEPCLESLKDAGVRAAVLSNFDSRLIDLIDAFELNAYFEEVHFSTGIGHAKPDREIFAAALSSHRIDASEAWHVGDSLHDDVTGARGAGLMPVWLDRAKSGVNDDPVIRIESLIDLPKLLS